MVSESLKFQPFLAILYSLKTPEKPWFSGAFRVFKMGTLARNGLKGKLALKRVLKSKGLRMNV